MDTPNFTVPGALGFLTPGHLPRWLTLPSTQLLPYLFPGSSHPFLTFGLDGLSLGKPSSPSSKLSAFPMCSQSSLSSAGHITLFVALTSL